ncbi:MAG TPA: hypothetical protein ENI85_08095 [Deltaproteobacteria bacterium]|nr:hypothetical protein [Deltaproteobacteria bacterium]
MQRRHRMMIAFVTSTLIFGSAFEALAQQSRVRSIDPILRGNPKRDAGGSCVYDRDGRVVFSPAGKECRDRRNHLMDLDTARSDLMAEFPPEVKKELARLLADHDHIADEVARLRHVIRNEDRNAALRAAEKISAELTDHTVREERFMEDLGRAPDAR